MSLDPLTLQAQLTLLRKNGADLEASANHKARQIQELTVQVEHHRGALAYNASLIQQIEAMIATPPATAEAQT